MAARITRIRQIYADFFQQIVRENPSHPCNPCCYFKDAVK